MLSPKVRTPAISCLGTPVRIPKNSPSSRIRVVAKVRPALSSEQGTRAVRICKDQSTGVADTLQITDENSGRNEYFKLDLCYGEHESAKHLFTMEVEPILPILFRGCNATVFAYGATGSGKTHTMQGGGQDDGLVPLSVGSILSLANEIEANVQISYYEVYMDRCYDLLVPESTEVFILEGFNGSIKLRNLSQVQVKTLEDFKEVFASGSSRRKVGETGLNSTSSRSHAVLTVSVTTGNVEDIEKLAVGKLNLIDLAGNEDNRRSGNGGVRLAESGRINQSLFALSNVINALNSNEARVPYRDSKLTRILQDSLGGTSCSLMISCLNPGSYHEAIHTLSLASKSRQIVTKFNPLSEEEPQKLDMESRLRAWREAKGRTCGKSSSLKVFSPWLNNSVTTPSSTLKSREMQTSRTEPRGDPTSAKMELITKLRARRVLNLDASDVIQDDKENTPFEHVTTGSPLRTFGGALREALSPISSIFVNHSSPSKVDTVDDCCTPLQKFNMTGKNVQNTLMKEYIHVLNKGNRDELLALKGIGEKRADYILQLREKNVSPIKELQDLQLIGLSEKLACNLFNGNVVRQIWLKN